MTKKKKEIDFALLPVEHANMLKLYQTQSEDMARIFGSTEVETKDQFEEMCVKLKKLSNFLTDVSSSATEMKEPHLKQVELIDNIETVILKPLREVSELVRSKMLTFLQQEVEIAKEESLKLIVEIDNKYMNYKEILRRLVSIKDQMIARLFTGRYEVFATREQKVIDTPASTSEMVMAIKKIIIEKYPVAEEFKGMAAFSSELRETLIRICDLLLSDYEKNGTYTKEEEEEYRKSAQLIVDNATFWLETMRKTNLKEAETIVKEAKQGRLRSMWKYKIVDIDAVPDIYKTTIVDKDKLKSFQQDCKEMYENGKQPIPGIQFYKDDSFVNV